MVKSVRYDTGGLRMAVAPHESGPRGTDFPPPLRKHASLAVGPRLCSAPGLPTFTGLSVFYRMQLIKHWAATLEDYVIDLGWSHDGQCLAAAASSGPVSLFAVADGVRRELPGHAEGTNCLAWHPGTALLATGGQDGEVAFWDGATGTAKGRQSLGGAWVEQLAWQPARTTTPTAASTTSAADAAETTADALLAAGAGRRLALLTATGTVRHTFTPAPKTITALAWHPTGGAVASAYFGGVCLWDADDFIAQKEYAYSNGIHALVWSPDGRWLVSGNQDPSVHLWLPEEDQEFHMSGYAMKVKELSFDRSSRWLATGGGEEVCLWDCTGAGPEGREPTMLPQSGRVCAVAFQHRRGTLATAATDGSVHLWSPERRQPLRVTAKLPAAATRLAWSPDDQLLAIGTERGGVYVLRVED